MKRILKMEDGFISTSEAQRMLCVSRAKVPRYFDRGIRTGEKRPIANLRTIKNVSIPALMKKYGLKWKDQA